MLKEIIANRNIINIDNKEVMLKYFLTKTSDQNNKNIYGICIEKYYNNQETFIDKEEIFKLSYSYEKTLALINKFAECTVTPTSLVEILDDLHFDD